MLTQIRVRRDTTAGWDAYNPTLASGEPGLDTTLGVLKIGDGVTPWADLPIYATAVAVDDVSGGTTVTVDWNDIANRPAAFPPDEHTHVAVDITDLTEVMQDLVANMMVAGANTTLTYNDAAGTLTVASAAGGGGGLDAEAVRDTIGAALVAAGPVSITVNDAGDTITINSSATANSPDATLLARANHTGTQASTTISDFTEAAQDAIAAFLVQGTNVTLVHDDAANTLTISTSATVNDTDANLKARANHTGTQTASTISDFNEAAMDAIAAALVAGSGVSITYNDAANSITVSASLVTEDVQDIVGAMVSSGNGVNVAYDDSTGFVAFSLGGRSTNTQTGTTYTFVLADKFTVIEGNNASAITFTVPPEASVPWVANSELEICQMGAGQITIAPGAGVTLRSRGGALKTAGQYAVVSLRKRATNEWVVTGDVTT